MTTKAATEIRDTTTDLDSRLSSTGATTRADLAAQASEATAQPPTTTALTTVTSTFTQASKQDNSVAAQAPPAEVSPPTPQNVVPSVLASLGLGPLATNGPVAPVEPPGMWVVLAWARRQSQQGLLDEPPSIGPDPAQTSLAVDSFATEESYGAESEQQTFALAAATAETNAAPQAAPTLNAPDDTTGVVAGSLNATDVDGDVLTYAVSGAPTGGTVTVDEAGNFVYTPTQATRLKAGSTAGGDIDSFTVTISDGQTTTAVPVTVAVSNEVTSVSSPIAVGTKPTGVATTTGTYAYVANQSSNTVSVIDSNNKVVSTITGFSAPTGVAASPDDSKVYVTNRSTGKVSVIDTNTNKVVSTITVGSAPTGVAVNPNDGRVLKSSPSSHCGLTVLPSSSTFPGTAAGDTAHDSVRRGFTCPHTGAA